MPLDHDLLIRYLRQQKELGGPELFLDGMTAEEAVRMLSARSGSTQHAATRRRGDTGSDLAGPNAASPRPRVAASESSELTVLGNEAAGCTRCGLAGTRTTVVFGEGNPNADVVVVGEAPGGEEDRTGRPFVGPAGKLLDLLLLSVGFPRESVYICNVLKCRPPNNRNPLPAEVESCSPFLRRQIELIQPRVLLAVGKFAAQTLVQSEETIGRLRGRVHRFLDRPVVVTYHPAYLLRNQRAVRTTWQDFQMLRQVMDE